MVDQYVMDSSAFIVLGHYYPSRFPTIWQHIDDLANQARLWSVREVLRELDHRSTEEHIAAWVDDHRSVFRSPSPAEIEIVTTMLGDKRYHGLVRLDSIQKGLPVADPFLVAAAKEYDAILVTREKPKTGAARIPNVCHAFGVECIDIERFLEKEKLGY